MVKRRVVCIFGNYGLKSDFVIEPTCSDDCMCEVCKDGFWIEEIENKKWWKLHKGRKRK